MSTETQEQTLTAQPQEQHRWLHKFEGEWNYEGNCTLPDGTAATFSGTESVRSAGGLWLIAEAEGTMPGGGSATMITTLGYDPRTERFVGTWIGSMMTHLWVYDGERSPDGRKLSLYAEGPDCQNPGALGKFKDEHEFISDDVRTLTGHMLQKDGTWRPMMTCRYFRRA